MDPRAKIAYEREEEVMRTMQHIKESNDSLAFTIRLIYVFFFVALIFMIDVKMEGMVISCVEGEIGGKPCGELTFAVVFDPLAFPTLKEQGEANLPHPFRDSIKEGLRNASEAIESTLEPAKEKASKWIEKAEEVVTDTLEPAKEKASKWIEKAEEVVTEKVSSFVDKANETLSEVESATKQAFSEMTEPAPVHPHPTYKPMKDVREPPVTMEIPTTEPVRVKVEIPTTGRVFTEPIPLREPVIESHHQHQVGFLDTIHTIVAAPIYLVELVFSLIMRFFGLPTPKSSVA